MHISQFFQNGRPVLSLEVFPPKKSTTVESIFPTLDSLKELQPDFISVTYGAGASTADTSTVQIASYIKQKLGIESLAHLTCVATTAEQARVRIAQFKEENIENVLALRGDRNPEIQPAKDFAHASDLTRMLKSGGDFYVAGACYPEGHYENKCLEQDIDNLKYKIEAGAGHLITQLFFDNGSFYRFIEKARSRGVTVPIQAGIMPIVNSRQIERTVALSGASLPLAFTKLVNQYEHDSEGLFKAGIQYAAEQINDLLANGAEGIHLYIMNNPVVAGKVYEEIRTALGR